MRIISGKFKGKSIQFLKSKNTRPLKDSVKENIFNVISHSNLLNVTLENSNILDLYSGIGSFGLECISRGAKNITFVEKDKNIAETLNHNLLSLSCIDKATIVTDKISNFLNNKMTKKYEIIFFDTPFADEDYIQELKIISKKKLYKKNHIIIIHREKKTLDNFENIIKPIIIKTYGRSKIIFATF